MESYFHIAVAAKFGRRPLEERTICAVLWARLRAAFPGVAAAVFMPDHFHVLAKGTDAGALKERVSSLLAGLSKTFPHLKSAWQPVALPPRIPNIKHLLRQIRYVHLNPCREGLAADPLEWEWSTHRDWMGAVLSAWPASWELSKQIGWIGAGAPERFHRYVSADPSVRVEGTPLPARPPEPSEWGVFKFKEVEWAVCSVARSPVRYSAQSKELRKLTVQILAREFGAKTGQLAAQLKCSESTVLRYKRAGENNPGLAAAGLAVRRVLSDPRMMKGYTHSV